MGRNFLPDPDGSESQRKAFWVCVVLLYVAVALFDLGRRGEKQTLLEWAIAVLIAWPIAALIGSALLSFVLGLLHGVLEKLSGQDW